MSDRHDRTLSSSIFLSHYTHLDTPCLPVKHMNSFYHSPYVLARRSNATVAPLSHAIIFLPVPNFAGKNWNPVPFLAPFQNFRYRPMTPYTLKFFQELECLRLFDGLAMNCERPKGEVYHLWTMLVSSLMVIAVSTLLWCTLFQHRRSFFRH